MSVPKGRRAVVAGVGLASPGKVATNPYALAPRATAAQPVATAR